jgi:hypothetical protein
VNGRRAVGAALLALGCAQAALADRGLRCGTHLVRVGDTKLDVLAHCGEPAFREVVSGGGGADSPLIEQWYYLLGPQRFPRVLTFRGLRLLSVEAEDYPG